MKETNVTDLVPHRHPGKLTKVAEVLEAIEQYFKKCDEREASYTMPGLAYYLGVADTRLLFRSGDDDLGRRKSPESTQTVKLFSGPDIQHALRLAKVRIEAQRVSQLLDDDNNTAAKIFDLKASFGWQDKQAISVENPDGNMASKVAVVLPGIPGRLSMAEWQKAYKEVQAAREKSLT